MRSLIKQQTKKKKDLFCKIVKYKNDRYLLLNILLFNPKTVFWTNVCKIVYLFKKKILPLI